jgi:hypothetical protein
VRLPTIATTIVQLCIVSTLAQRSPFIALSFRFRSFISSVKEAQSVLDSM